MFAAAPAAQRRAGGAASRRVDDDAASHESRLTEDARYEVLRFLDWRAHSYTSQISKDWARLRPPWVESCGADDGGKGLAVGFSDSGEYVQTCQCHGHGGESGATLAHCYGLSDAGVRGGMALRATADYAEFSPDGKLLAAVYDDQGILRVYDVRENWQVGPDLRREDVTRAVAFSADNATLAVGLVKDYEGAVAIYELPSDPKPVPRPRRFGGMEGWKKHVRREDEFWRGQLRREDEFEIGRLRREDGFLSRGIYALELSRDGALVAVAYGDERNENYRVRVYDATGAVRWTVTSDMPTFALAFGPDCATLATGGFAEGDYGEWGGDYMSNVSLNDAATGKIQMRPELEDESMTCCMAYSPDGATLGIGDRSGNLTLYDTSTWTRRRERGEGDQNAMEQLVFSPDSSKVVALRMKQIQLYDVATLALRRRRRHIPLHYNPMTDAWQKEPPTEAEVAVAKAEWDRRDAAAAARRAAAALARRDAAAGPGTQ